MVFSPFSVFGAIGRHWTLVRQFAVRDIASRFRGSILGILWFVLNPLILLAVYTFVFRQVLAVRWGEGVAHDGHFAVILFAGLAVFGLFSEVLVRTPGLLLENPAFIKKVVFPLEAIPIATVLSACLGLLVSLVILAIFHLFLIGPPPWTSLLVVPVVAPLVLFLFGLAWFLSSIGVFLRDIRQFVAGVSTLLMFLCPIFYPLSAVPESMRGLILLNPMTFIVEQTRAVMIWGVQPDWGALLLYTLVAWLFAWLGLMWFRRTQRGFADVV